MRGPALPLSWKPSRPQNRSRAEASAALRVTPEFRSLSSLEHGVLVSFRETAASGTGTTTRHCIPVNGPSGMLPHRVQLRFSCWQRPGLVYAKDGVVVMCLIVDRCRTACLARSGTHGSYSYHLSLPRHRSLAETPKVRAKVQNPLACISHFHNSSPCEETGEARGRSAVPGSQKPTTDAFRCSSRWNR